MASPLRFIRPHLLALDAYEAVDPPEALAARAGVPESQIIKLNGNENPYGASPKVAEALANLHRAHLYPDPQQVAMRQAVSDYVGLGPEYVVVGNGSDEIIDLLFRAVLEPGDSVLSFSPTFGMYGFEAQLCGATMISVPRDAHFAIDLDASLETIGERTKILVVASPNNPTGNSASPEAVRRLLAGERLVIVDEAYVEFGGQSVVELVPEHANLIVLRTLSKWAGLAGLRVGYGVMAMELADLLLKAKPPYNVNQAAEAALLASFWDRELLEERVRLIVDERQRMARLLADLDGLTPWPSDANFILCGVPVGRGRAVYEGLARRGVFVRYFSNPRLADCIRISVGTPQQTDRLIEALAAALRD